MVYPKDTVPRLSPILEPFVDLTCGTTRILTGDSHDRKPGPEPPPGLSCHLKLNSDTTELTLVECVRTRIQDSTLISPILDRAYEALSNKTCNPLLNRVDTSTGVVTPPKTIETKGIASLNWTRPSLRSGQSPDSTASSLTGTAWKPGHHTQRDYSDTRMSEAGWVLKDHLLSTNYTDPLHVDYYMHTSRNTLQDPRRDSGSVMPVSNERARSMTNESLTNENSVDQELLRRRTLLASVADSIRREQGPSAAADVRLINTSLYHLAYNLDVESPSFTSTVVRASRTGHPTVFKPDTEFCLTLLQCGQILQDTAAEMAKHYFLSDPDPYKFDPGGMLAVHMTALALRRLRTGLKIIAQLQSVDENESVAYTTNSKAQGYVTGIVNNPPRVASPLAAYSVPERGLLWQSQEIPTPGTLASDEGTQLPRPRFDVRQPRPSVDPLRQQVLANSTRTTDWWTPPWLLESHLITDGRKAHTGIPQMGGPRMEMTQGTEMDPLVEGWPNNGPPGPGPPDRGPPAVGIDDAARQREAYYEPKFKLEFRPNDLPEYDGSDNAFVTWTEDLDHYTAGSCRMREQLAFAATMRFTKHADVWWRSLPNATKIQASQDWDSLKLIMRTRLLGTRWYDKQVTIYDELRFRNRGHEKETPTEWLTRKVRACRVLHPLPDIPDPVFDSLEVGTLMEHTPPSWRAYVDVDLCHDTDALFSRVKDQEDALLAISNLSNSRQTEDIANEVIRRVHEDLRRSRYRSPAMMASSSSLELSYAYEPSDVRSKRKPIRPCRHCGSKLHYDYDCGSYKKDPKRAKPTTSTRRDVAYRKAYIAMTSGSEEVYQAAMVAAHEALSSEEEDKKTDILFTVPDESSLEGIVCYVVPGEGGSAPDLNIDKTHDSPEEVYAPEPTVKGPQD
ncbi:hypothetical protein BS47DRAFT_1390654 [Hydnum rufescens UP504]|uniref:Uncharacterized protein n=1 Tax=Hydnum rufescens UP504 TaxID=1448309 RepID=A0A9P6B2Z0_9AGAM|nr:hypothetical protein BS47DRAFT_1390654 [Hydnum rufescens UP504]